MSPKRGQGGLRRASQFLVDALAGRVGVLMMTLSYASLAVVLLAYVSTQVYTSSLMEEVARRQDDRRLMEERIGAMMGDYGGLVSRARVASFCENKLGMVEADPSRMTRVRISPGVHVPSRTDDSSLEHMEVSELLGANLLGAPEVRQR